MRRPLAVAVLLALAACRGDTLTVFSPGELPEDVYGSPSPAATVELPREGTVYMLRDGRLVAVRGPLPGVASSLPEALLLTLLQGPAGPDTRTAIPRDTRINALDVEGGVATVDLSEEFERGASGDLLALRLAQVVYSLTEAEEVQSVRFSIDGFPTAVVDGAGNVRPGPVGRADYERFAPKGAGAAGA